MSIPTVHGVACGQVMRRASAFCPTCRHPVGKRVRWQRAGRSSKHFVAALPLAAFSAYLVSIGHDTRTIGALLAGCIVALVVYYRF